MGANSLWKWHILVPNRRATHCGREITKQIVLNIFQSKTQKIMAVSEAGYDVATCVKCREKHDAVQGYKRETNSDIPISITDMGNLPRPRGRNAIREQHQQSISNRNTI